MTHAEASQRGDTDHERASEPAPQVGGDEERPHHQRHERQVPRLEMQGDRQHDEEDGGQRGAQRRQGPVGEAPRQRQRPRRPQLRPHAVADPDVRLRLVADAGGRREEGRHRRRRRRRPAAQAEQAAAPVHRDRPQGEQQVQRPAEHGVGVEHRPERARDHGGQALVVQVLRRAQPEVGEPARQGQMALADPAGRHAHHLLVQGAVVEVGHGAELGAELPQAPHDGDGDEQPWPDPVRRPGTRRARGRRGRVLLGGAHGAP